MRALLPCMLCQHWLVCVLMAVGKRLKGSRGLLVATMTRYLASSASLALLELRGGVQGRLAAMSLRCPGTDAVVDCTGPSLDADAQQHGGVNHWPHVHHLLSDQCWPASLSYTTTYQEAPWAPA